jgi:hypothetical protein
MAHVGEDINLGMLLAEKPEGKIPLEGPRQSWWFI